MQTLCPVSFWICQFLNLVSTTYRSWDNGLLKWGVLIKGHKLWRFSGILLWRHCNPITCSMSWKCVLYIMPLLDFPVFGIMDWCNRWWTFFSLHWTMILDNDYVPQYYHLLSIIDCHFCKYFPGWLPCERQVFVLMGVSLAQFML